MADETFASVIKGMLDREVLGHSNRYYFVEALREDVLSAESSSAQRLAIVRYLSEEQEGRPSTATLPNLVDYEERHVALVAALLRIYGSPDRQAPPVEEGS